MPPGSATGDREIAGQTFRLYTPEAVQPLASVAVMVTPVPAPFPIVGVPEKLPVAVLKEMPVGSVPEFISNV